MTLIGYDPGRNGGLQQEGCGVRGRVRGHLRLRPNPGDEEATISARVEVTQRDRLGGKEPLPMLGSLGATRLLSMLRREPDFVIPFMGLVRSACGGLRPTTGPAP